MRLFGPSKKELARREAEQQTQILLQNQVAIIAKLRSDLASESRRGQELQQELQGVLSGLEQAQVALRIAKDDAQKAAQEHQAEMDRVKSLHAGEVILAVIDLDPARMELMLRQIEETIRVHWEGWRLYIYATTELAIPARNALEDRLRNVLTVRR